MKRSSQNKSSNLIEQLKLNWLNLLDESSTDIKSEDEIFTSLIESYSDRHRSYHNLKHIYDILNSIERVKNIANNTKVLQFSAWFHDCIYDPQSIDNEAKSADSAVEALNQLNINCQVIKVVEQIILSTKNHQPLIEGIDNLLFLDIDLAILGTTPDKYQKYSQAIREEYSYLSDRDYQTGRKKVLFQFLNRERIYYTDFFYRRLETVARENLQTEIKYLDRLNLV